MSAIVPQSSPSRTITYRNWSRIEGQKARFSRLRAIARQNINNTRRLFLHNQAHNIKLFRLTSKLIPLATHPAVQEWQWSVELEDELKTLGEYARANHFRLSAHPDHFTLLNSPRSEVTAASVKDLEYHLKLMETMRLDASAKLIIHVGGSYGDKEAALNRFTENYSLLPAELKQRIILENDDKIYTARDVLKLCRQLRIPMVLDIHHHWCHNNNEEIGDYLPDIFATWDSESRPPKIHLSSPRDPQNFRSHADDVEPSLFLKFLARAKPLNRDFDVMIEAKNKDLALFNLMAELKTLPYIRIIDKADIEV